jgi:hypothetical protein
MGTNRRIKVGLLVTPVLLAGIVATPAAVANGLATTNIGLAADPPASSPGDAVTYTATVSDPAEATTPTGSVTFTYQVTGTGGGHTVYVIGTSALQGLQTGTAVASITLTPNAPPPSVNGGAPLPDGVVMITAAYSGDATFAAATSGTTDFVEAGCKTGAWPQQTEGYPEVFARYPEGFYIGQVNGWWSLYATHPYDGNAVFFSGTVKTNGNLIDLSATKEEANDVVTLKGGDKVMFKFKNRSLLDGFTFYAGCGSKLSFKMMINGAKAPTAAANLGNPTTNPGHTLIFKRSS